jgi:hypothetical protein
MALPGNAMYQYRQGVFEIESLEEESRLNDALASGGLVA